MALHRNYINGEWLEGKGVRENINPSDITDIVGEYAQADKAQTEAAIAAEIGKFLMNGSLYRGLRPVMWSPVEKTALAEAEIEYHDHVSPTLHAKFRILKAGAADLVGALPHALRPQSRTSVRPWTG